MVTMAPDGTVNPRDDGAPDPRWHASGWTPVFVGEPETPGSRIIGHTRLRMPAAAVRIFKITTRHPSGMGMRLHGDMLLKPHTDAVGELIWAWELTDPGDVALVPTFRPL